MSEEANGDFDKERKDSCGNCFLFIRQWRLRDIPCSVNAALLGPNLHPRVFPHVHMLDPLSWCMAQSNSVCLFGLSSLARWWVFTAFVPRSTAVGIIFPLWKVSDAEWIWKKPRRSFSICLPVNQQVCRVCVSPEQASQTEMKWENI